jgi:hypothetical protein
VNLPNPQDLDALLAVLRARRVVGFEVAGADGARTIIQLAPDAPEPPSNLVERLPDVEPGGWKRSGQ